MFNYFVLSLLLYWSNEVTGKYKGEACSTNNGTGTCQSIHNCPQAIDDLKKGVFPTNCGFQGKDAIICCVIISQKVVHTTAKSTTSYISNEKRVPGEISKQKCKEYQKYAYGRVILPILISGTKEVITGCSFGSAPLINDGSVAYNGEFPHMAQLGYINDNETIWACAGSIISENFVLVAAHCLTPISLGPPKLVRVGLTDLRRTDHIQQMNIKESIIYPEYSWRKYNDIGLVRLEKNFEMNTFVRPACLQTEKAIDHSLAIHSGWPNKFVEDNDDHLNRVILEIITTQECNDSYRAHISQSSSRLDKGILEEQICAVTGQRENCQIGTSAPLQIYHPKEKCMYSIIGVSSFGKLCVSRKSPIVYTRVSAYIKWIENIVWPQ